MTLKRSLYRLELNQPKDEGELLVHLARLLGAVDATIFPARYQHTARAQYAAACDASKRYFTEGLSYVLPGSDANSWKTSSRFRQAMQEAGWVLSCGGGKIRLTPEGDCIARMACNLPNLNSELVRLYFSYLGECKPERGKDWVSEASWFGLEDDTDWESIFTFWELAAPLLVHRAVEAHSSTTARIYYRRLADSIPRIDVPEIERNDDCVDAYTQSFCKAMDARKTAEYGGSEIFIPLSAT